MPMEDNKRSSVRKKHNKDRGFLFEQLFIYESLKKNIISHKPVLDPSCHDLIVLDDKGCVSIVQVKSIRYRTYDNKINKGCFKYSIKATCDSDKTLLKDSYVDILAVYAVNEKVWYLIPTAAIGTKTIVIYPHIECSKGGYEKFKESWSVFSDAQVCRKS
jgi:hypothetical protein